MKVGTRVDQPRKDRIGAPEKLPRLGIATAEVFLRVCPSRTRFARLARGAPAAASAWDFSVIPSSSLSVRHDIDDR